VSRKNLYTCIPLMFTQTTICVVWFFSFDEMGLDKVLSGVKDVCLDKNSRYLTAGHHGLRCTMRLTTSKLFNRKIILKFSHYKLLLIDAVPKYKLTNGDRIMKKKMTNLGSYLVMMRSFNYAPSKGIRYTCGLNRIFFKMLLWFENCRFQLHVFGKIVA